MIFERGKQLLTVFGVVGAIASAAAFVLPYAKSVWGNMTDPQIEVRTLRSETTDTLIRNIGARPVIVTRYEARMLDDQENDIVFSNVINTVLQPGEVVRPDLRSQETLRIQASQTLDFFRKQTVGGVGFRDAFLMALKDGNEPKRTALRIQVYGEDTTDVRDARDFDLSSMRQPSELLLLNFSCTFFFSATNDQEECSIDVPCAGFPSTSLSELEFAKLMGKYQ